MPGRGNGKNKDPEVAACVACPKESKGPTVTQVQCTRSERCEVREVMGT